MTCQSPTCRSSCTRLTSPPPSLPAAAPSPAPAPAACFDGPLVSATAALCSVTASAFSLPAFKAAVAAFLASSGASFGQVLVNTTRPEVQLSDCQTGTQNVQVQIEAAGPAILVPVLPGTPAQPSTASTAQTGEPTVHCQHVQSSPLLAMGLPMDTYLPMHSAIHSKGPSLSVSHCASLIILMSWKEACMVDAGFIMDPQVVCSCAGRKLLRSSTGNRRWGTVEATGSSLLTALFRPRKRAARAGRRMLQVGRWPLHQAPAHHATQPPRTLCLGDCSCAALMGLADSGLSAVGPGIAARWRVTTLQQAPTSDRCPLCSTLSWLQQS